MFIGILVLQRAEMAKSEKCLLCRGGPNLLLAMHMASPKAINSNVFHSLVFEK